MIEVGRVRVFWNLLFSDSKLFIAFFRLAGKCGTSHFHNTLVSTRLCLITVVSSRIFRDVFWSGGSNSDDSCGNVPHYKFFWSMVLTELSQRKV